MRWTRLRVTGSGKSHDGHVTIKLHKHVTKHVAKERLSLGRVIW